MTDMFEKAFRNKKHGYHGYMVVQVAYFRDKFDPKKLCAFVELKTEDGTQDLVDLYNATLFIYCALFTVQLFKRTECAIF